MIFAAGPEEHSLFLVQEEPWNTAVIILDTVRFNSCQQVEEGIYQCTYPGRMAVKDTDHPIHVLLIVVVSYLRHHIRTSHADLNDALEKAIRDSEWLILPLDPSEGAPSELTAMLDDGCISDFERYRFEIP